MLIQKVFNILLMRDLPQDQEQLVESSNFSNLDQETTGSMLTIEFLELLTFGGLDLSGLAQL